MFAKQRTKKMMTRFNVYVLATGRLIQLSIHAATNAPIPSMDLKVDLLIKDPNEEEFHPVIGIDHPNFIKLQQMDAEQALNLQIKHSGVSATKIRQAVQNFKNKLSAETFARTFCNN